MDSTKLHWTASEAISATARCIAPSRDSEASPSIRPHAEWMALSTMVKSWYQMQDHLADHALVLMFVPLFENWVQPTASFATKGAAPGKVIAKPVMSSVLELHKNNEPVLAVISNGAGNNRSMWSQFGVSGKMDATCHFIQHPWELSQNTYFICDVPHIVKCIRNHPRKNAYTKEKMCEFSEQFNYSFLLLPGWQPSNQLSALRDPIQNRKK